MKQTAVEWFAKELNNWRIKEFGEDAIIGIPIEVFEQAKAMEKEQIENVFDIVCKRANETKDKFYTTAEDYGFNYYNETFKSE